MVAVSTTWWWVIGYAIGAAVVLVAAALLVAIILLARRIARQAGLITDALDGARRNTQALFDLGQMNHAVERLSRALKSGAGRVGIQDERGPLRKLVDRLLPSGG